MSKPFDREKYLSIGFAGVKPTVSYHARDVDRAPVGAHISHSLPRFTPYHKGKFTKNGKPIVRTKSERDHITKASGGKYIYD